MKVKAYVRVARPPKGRSGKPKVAINPKPNHTPLGTEGAWWPTVYFAMELDLPDDLFNQAETVVATLNVKDGQIAATVREIA